MDSKQESEATQTVLIIGGGMAAIKLAHTLSNAGINFQIIEVSDYLGGRVRCIDF